jgi:hypothetical protein
MGGGGVTANFNYAVKSLGQQICGTGGTVKEDLKNRVSWPGIPAWKANEPDLLDQGDPNLLYLNGNYIVDKKGVDLHFEVAGNEASWDSVPAGTVIQTLDQTCKLIINDPCGNPHTYDLAGTLHVEMKKVSSNPDQVQVTVTQ